MTPIERFQQLQPRERRLFSILLGAVVVAFLIGIPALLEVMVASRTTDNEALQAALDAVQSSRSQVKERQARKDSIAARYSHEAPALAGYLQQQAVAQKLDVVDSVDNPDIPHGKRYVERSTRIHLKKGGMYAVAEFLQSIESSGMPLAVSRLNIRKRPGEPDSFDCEVGVSAYDKSKKPVSADPAPSGSAEPGKTP